MVMTRYDRVIKQSQELLIQQSIDVLLLSNFFLPETIVQEDGPSYRFDRASNAQNNDEEHFHPR